MLSDVVGEQIAVWRRANGMNREALAERCQELGLPKMSPSVITNIESGRRVKGSPRRTVTVDELVVFALALSVPIGRLMIPYPDQESVQLTPAVEVPTADALAWFEGEKLLDVTGHNDQRMWQDARMPAAALKVHDQLVRTWRRHVERVSSFDRRAKELASQSQRAQAALDAAEQAGDNPSDRISVLKTAAMLSRDSEAHSRDQLDGAIKQLRGIEQQIVLLRDALRERGFPTPELGPEAAHIADAVPDEDYKQTEVEPLMRELRGEW